MRFKNCNDFYALTVFDLNVDFPDFLELLKLLSNLLEITHIWNNDFCCLNPALLWRNMYQYCCDQKAWAASAQSFILWQQATIEITCDDHSIIACSCHMSVVLRAHPIRGESHIPGNANGEVATTSFFLQWMAPTTHSFCEVCTWHDLHILVTVPFCCDRKARAASVQSFTLWQQATTEITCHDHSIIACSCHMYMGVVLCTHPVCSELHIQTQLQWRGCNSTP